MGESETCRAAVLSDVRESSSRHARLNGRGSSTNARNCGVHAFMHACALIGEADDTTSQ